MTDEDGHVTDLYTEAVNSGHCLDYEMGRISEREAKQSPTLAEDEVERDESEADTEEVIDRGTVMGVERKKKRQAAEEARGEVGNEMERVAERETSANVNEETQRGAMEEAKREALEEAKRVAVEETKREVNDGVERAAERKVRMEEVDAGTLEEQAESEFEGTTEEEVGNEVGNEAKMDAEEEESEIEEAARAVRNEEEEDPKDAADTWDLAKEELQGVFDLEKRSALKQNANKELKSRRRSGVEEKETGTDRDDEDRMQYMNRRSGEADDGKVFEGQ